MVSLTFAEQVKIILNRRSMTIKELAEVIESESGKKMSRQNLTQRLNRDNFQEQDMRMIAEILGCSFHLNIIDNTEAEEGAIAPTEEELEKVNRRRDKALGKTDSQDEEEDTERDITMGELVDMMNVAEAEIDRLVEDIPESNEEPEIPDSEDVIKTYIKNAEGEKELEIPEEMEIETEMPEEEEVVEAPPEPKITWSSRQASEPVRPSYSFVRPTAPRPVQQEIPPQPAPQPEEEDLERGDVNPYTGHEYKSNSVRIHPKRIGYVQVYDRAEHKWTDMTEWAFLGYQERKKALLGKDYEPPIYLD